MTKAPRGRIWVKGLRYGARYLLVICLKSKWY